MGWGKTRVAMYLALLSIPINVLANYAFIYGKWGAPRMELEGAGVGTLIARLFILVALGLLILREKNLPPTGSICKTSSNFERIDSGISFASAFPPACSMGWNRLLFAVTGIMSGWLGYIQQASHQIAISLASFTFMVSTGISAAGSIRVAYAYGRSDWSKARYIGSTTLVMAVVYGIFCGILFISGRFHLPLLFNDEVQVVQYAAWLLFSAAVFQISDSVQAISVGLLRGLQDVRIPTLFVLLALLGLRHSDGLLPGF
jgi:MATE family multidrug resistance protein